MNIHNDFISECREAEMLGFVDEFLSKHPERRRGERNRIVRFGWDYEKPSKWLCEIPAWSVTFRTATHDRAPHRWDVKCDSVTINEYLKGQHISPHIDSPKFGDIAILSLMADCTMRFTSPAGETKDFPLPRRSLAVMSGELRTKWKHETLPLESERRISIVYRNRL